MALLRPRGRGGPAPPPSLIAMQIGKLYTADDGSSVQLQALVKPDAQPDAEGRWADGDIVDWRLLYRDPTSAFPLAVVYDSRRFHNGEWLPAGVDVRLCRDDRSFVADGIIREANAW